MGVKSDPMIEQDTKTEEAIYLWKVPQRDPYARTIHMAHLVRKQGVVREHDGPWKETGPKEDDSGVSALCFKRPRAINLRVASWSNRVEAVTCKKCLAILDPL